MKRNSTFIALGIIIIIVLSLVGIFYFNINKLNNNGYVINSTPTPILTPIPLRLSFDPPTIKIPKEINNISSDIKLSAGPNDIREVTIVILCDPTRVKNLKLVQKKDRYSALSYSFAPTKAKINNNTCEAILTLSTPNNNPAQRGSGIIANVTAEVIGKSPTQIQILPQSTGKAENPRVEFQTERVNLELTP